MCARLEIIMGSMFSGKTSELIRRLKRHRIIHRKILVVNSYKDCRNDGDVLQTHDRDTFACIKTVTLMFILGTDDYRSSDVIAVDEAQFYGFGDLYEFVQQALRDDKHVLVAGLDGDFQQRTFGELFSLIPLADEVTKLTALCMECLDGTLGPFTKRIIDDSTQELIGDTNMYRAVCRKHL